MTPEAREQRPPAGAARSAASVRLIGLSKHYPSRRTWAEIVRHPRATRVVPVLREVTLEVQEGEFFGLLGPNGAGKTTLFKILATLVTPDEGTAVVAGHDVRAEPAAVRELLTPVVTDERSLHWRISARENLRLFATLRGVPTAAVADRVQELLHVVGLADIDERMVGTFSSGMKQRLLIARALLARPRVLLLDEPTRSLDPLSARRFRQFLREDIAAGQGCTVLLATHSAEEALDLCDRIAILDRGRLLAVGTTEALSRELEEERYRLWTNRPDDPSLRALAERGTIAKVEQVGVDRDGWFRVEMEVPGGADRAAQVVDYLTCARVQVARFERVELSLAELIERIVERRGERRGGSDHA